MARKRYLKKTPLTEARALFLSTVDPARLASEEIAVEGAEDRITAEPVFAKISSPHYHASAMDGICVRAEDTFGATEFVGKKLTLADSVSPRSGAFEYLDTGNSLPPWANAVIMIEKVHQIDDRTVEIFESVAPWNHVRLVGEDVVATELLLPRSHRLRPYDLGALLAAGHTTVRVKARPIVGIIPTGDELIQPGEEAKPGAVIEFNSTVLAAFVREWGGTPVKYPRAKDDLTLLIGAVRQAADECDLVTVIAGSSAGEHDLTADVVTEAGKLLAHGIDVMPGKPAVLGQVAGKPLIGVPGYPVSAIVIAREILRPAIEKFLGSAVPAYPTVRAIVPKKIASHLGLEEFIRVTLGRVGEKLVAVPLARGAGVITTMVHADGLLRVPSLVEGLNAGEQADVELLRPIEDIENTILCTGSHDLAIGVLEDQLKLRHPELKIAATNVGSLGGLLALQRGETHLAGTHLLDPETGVYNIPDIKRTIPKVPVVLVHLAQREQGILVAPGNPKAIGSLKDLARKGVRFVNRQPGSGTRVLLDYELKRLGIESGSINGYQREEFTHMAVGVAIASGLADAGLGVRAAANALALDFIPIAAEQYDLLFHRSFFESASGNRLVEILTSAGLKSAVASLGGYDTERCGEILYRQ
ncbi:MAG: molybdopterin biosynthesis protein [Deltaproteobacteria bacterium]|nr:molybdopterin biosynthesis protein [Deltaproteobacteria bacterium]MBI3064084.1 molybdopterin biosynthesis protein [Deltaproteobacteria bacterium]